MQKLTQEIPAFLHFIKQRSFASEKKTRMWFTPKQIYTPALKKLVSNNRNRVEKEIAQILISVLEKFDLDKVDFVPFDLLNALNKTRVKTDLTQIRTILKKDWNITNQKNSLLYRKFTVLSDGDIVLSDNKGRYFSVDKVFLMKNFDELMNNE